MVFHLVSCWLCFVCLWLAVEGDGGFNETKSCENLDLPVFLTPLIDKNQTEQAREMSLVDNTFLDVTHFYTSHAGYFTVDPILGNHMFFWFFPHKVDASAPLLLWLNGGPTVSSMLGLFHENGPMALGKEESKRDVPRYYARKHAWTDRFSMLYVDNPVNVGFSYSDSGEEGDTFTEEKITQNLYSVLKQFLLVFPEYGEREIYLGGQSYAGMYTISLAHFIHTQMNQGQRDFVISGIYLGGPFFEPEIQLPAIVDFQYHLGDVSYKTLKDYEKLVDKLFKNKDAVLNITNPFSVILNVFFPWMARNNFITQEIPPYESLTALMNSPDIKRAVHAGRDRTFRAFNKDMRDKFSVDSMTSRMDKLGVLLEHYKVLIFNGDLDALVSTVSIDAALMRTTWVGQREFNNTRRSFLKKGKEKEVTLYYSRVRQLCRVIIRGAGHQTPYDRPEMTLRVMEDFINHGCVREKEGEVKGQHRDPPLEFR